MRLIFICSTLLVIITSEVESQPRNPLYSGQAQFAQDLFAKIALQEKNKRTNILIAPYSLYNALLLAYSVSSGETEAAMRQALHLPEHMNQDMIVDELKRTFLPKTPEEGLLNAEALFVDNALHVKDDQLSSLKGKIIRANLHSAGIVNTMNSWAATHTKNEIREMINKPYDENVNLALGSAAHFNGTWHFKMDKLYSDFYPKTYDDDPVRIEFLKVKERIFERLHGESGVGSRTVEVPYAGGETSLFVTKGESSSSTDGHNVYDYINRYYNVTTSWLEDVFQGIRTRHKFRLGDWYYFFPLIKLEHFTDISEDLMDLGFDKLLTPRSNLSKLTDEYFGGVNSVTHKAKVDLDTEGVTPQGLEERKYSCYMPLDAAQPFMFVVYNKVHDLILFMGIYNTPP